MALHYISNTEKTACGRTANGANVTSIATDVTCKNCCKSQAYMSTVPAAVASTAAPAPAVAPPVDQVKPTDKSVEVQKYKAAPRTAAVAFGEWATQLCNNDRLPRGKFFARMRQAA